MGEAPEPCPETRWYEIILPIITNRRLMKYYGIDIFSGAGGLSLGAEMAGIIRTYGLDERTRMCRELEARCNEIALGFGAKCDCKITDSCVGIVNDNDAITSMCERTAREVFGSANVHIIEKPLFISEDFGEFIIAKTGCFYHIGAGCEYPLHSDKFLPVPEAIVTASAMHSSSVYAYNKQEV